MATLTSDMARVAADLIDEKLVPFGAAPSTAWLRRDCIGLHYTDATTRRAAALALGLTTWEQAAGIVTQAGLVGGDYGEVAVEAFSRLDAEDLRREREDAETAARAAAAVTS